MATLKFAMVCYSNQNRSMEAHKVLAEAGFDVVSYGVGTCVRLPGASQHEPNIYEFGTPYRTILWDLKSKPASHQPHYERLGLYSMLERNVLVKEKPEKWQLSDVGEVDVAITFEERVMDSMLEDMAFRTTTTMKPLLIVNLEVPDNNKEALAAAQQVATLAKMLQQASQAVGDWKMLDLPDLLNRFEAQTARKTLFSIAFF